MAWWFVVDDQMHCMCKNDISSKKILGIERRRFTQISTFKFLNLTIQTDTHLYFSYPKKLTQVGQKNMSSQLTPRKKS